MKRSGFKQPTYEEALSRRIASQGRRTAKAARKPRPERQSPARSGIARKSTLSQHRRRPLGAGKKVKAWESERRKLKKRFEKVGITSCEFGFIEHDCRYDDFLSFAHSCKRSDPEFDIQQVALACIPVHTILDEQMSHAEMKEAVMRAIQQREIQP